MSALGRSIMALILVVLVAVLYYRTQPGHDMRKATPQTVELAELKEAMAAHMQIEDAAQLTGHESALDPEQSPALQQSAPEDQRVKVLPIMVLRAGDAEQDD